MDAVDVAINAVLLDSQVHSTIRINREAEGTESRAFKDLFQRQPIGKSHLKS